ncbi:MAG: AIDA repeat-containing protein, partial [Kiritimatiellae bacterium]|nr:AIDA repeat-containing protein [Kiritimatiellia bacterium]
MDYYISPEETSTGIGLENGAMHVGGVANQTFVSGDDVGAIPPSNTATTQIVYLDFDGAETSYHNRDLNLAIDNLQVEDSGFESADITVIVASLNGLFDDVVFTTELPFDGEYSTIYIGVTSAFDQYGSFLGLAETIDSGNQIHDDNAFVLLDSSATAQMVVSVIAHETEHIVHGMDHGGEGLNRYASDYVVSSGEVVIAKTIGPGTDTLLVENGGLVLSATIQTSAVMTVDNGGMVSSATVNFNGIAHVSSGGVVSNATLNNGSMYIGGDVGSVVNSFGALVINAGGEVQSVTMSNGGMSIGGTVVSTTLSAGVVHVNGGTATTMTMYNGTLMIYSGGVASSLVISKGQVSVLSGGVVENTTVNVGATLTVSSGASATGIHWTPFQGKVNVAVGGFATFVNSGYYYGSGNSLWDNGMSISGIEVASGYSMYVFDNGLVENATVDAGGTMTVCNGGVAENTTVDAGGTLTVGAGASATDIIWTPFQGEVIVNVGGYATFVNSGYYYGSGNALWDSGLSISEIEVDGGCSLYVFDNGLVENATVYEGGVMNVFNGGVAGVPENGESGGVLINWGTLIVGAGGEAQFVTLDGGSMTIGGTVVRTSLCAGTMTVSSGTANSTTMQAGTLEIMSGGLASSLRVFSQGSVNVLNGGKASTVTLSGAMTVSSGGVAIGVAVSGVGVITVDGGFASNVNAYYDNGIMTVKNGGRAEKMELHSGGTMVVASSGVLYNTMLRGGCSMIVHDEGVASAVSVSGVMNVFDGGVASGNTIEYGTINLSNGGTASDTTMNGGTMTISNGGTASDTTMNSGTMTISKGGVASDTTMNDGAMTISSGGTALNITQAGGSLKADLLQTEVNGTNSNGDFSINNGEASNFIGELMLYSGLATNMTVEAGCILNIYDGGSASEMQVEDNGVINISNGGVASDTTVEGGTMNLYDGATADSVTQNLGTVNIYSGGLAFEVEAMGGTLNVAATAELDGADIGGATVNVASGVVARNLEVNAGTLNVEAGADVDGVTYNGGTFIISSGVTIKNLYKIAGGTVNMYGNAVVDGGVLEGGGYLQALAQNGASGAVIRNYELRGGADDAVIVRAGGNKAENIAVYGGILYIQSGASASDVDVYDGGTIATPDAGRGGATMENIRIHAGGQGVFAANAARAMTIDGLTMDEYAAATFSSANVADFNATGGELTLIGQKNYVSGSGTIEDITVLGNGQLWINDPYDATSGGAAYAQMVNSNLTVEAGATVLLLGTNVHGSDAQIWGNYYVQNGATLSGGVVHDGGSLYMGQRSNYNDNGVRTKVVGVTVNSNGTVSVADGDFINMAMEEGAVMNISNGGVASDTTMSGGTMNVFAGGTHSGTLSIASGAVVSAHSGAVIDFTMAAQEDKDVPLIDHYDYIAGAEDATYTLTIASDLDTGSYALAGYATDFNSTITVKTNAQEVLGSLSMTELLNTNGFSYQLSLTDGTLFLDIFLDTEAPVLSSIAASPAGATNQDVTVTAIFTDNVGVVSTQYRIDGGAWQEYEDGVVMTANGTVEFQASDAAGNASDIARYEVTNIDKVAPEPPTASADVTDPTNGDVTVTAIFSDDSTVKEYSLDGQTWETYTQGIVMEGNGTVFFRGTDAAGNVSDVTTYGVTNIDKVAPVIDLVGDNTTPLQASTLTASAENGVDIFWSTDNAAWTEYTGEISIEANGTYYFKATDAAGNTGTASITFTNIDKVAPEAPTASADITEPTNQSVTVTAVFSADSVVKQYSLDVGQSWQDYADGVVFEANGSIIFKAIDAAGNEAVSEAFAVANIDKVAPEAPTASADITDPTNGDVTVTATFSDDSTSKEYSLDGQTWNAYAEPIVLSGNGAVSFRGTDAAGNFSTVTTYEVTNIDKVAPEAPTASADITAPTNQAVTVTATFSDDSILKEYSLDGQTWSTYTEPIVFSDNGTIYFRSTDAAGNVSDVASYEVSNIDKVAPEAPTASADITALTNGDVTVTAVFSDDSAVKEYSLDGQTWIAYTQGAVFSDNGTVSFRGTDAAGNVSDVTTYEVANIDKTAPVIKLVGDTTTPLQASTLTASTENGVDIFWSTDNAAWTEYTGEISIEANGT